MSDKHNADMIELEKELASVEIDAVEEEQELATMNYSILDTELADIRAAIPYPETGKFSTGIDYEDIDRLKYEKNSNAPFWMKEDEQLLYCKNGGLYSGHINLGGSTDYFIMESPNLKSRSLGNSRIINVDDEGYSWVMQAWRYPDEHTDVKLSRNIIMKSRQVKDVDVVLDKGSSLFANITDAYLRKALIRNKNQIGAQSIIQTIQRKQDGIRSLPADSSFVVQGCAGSGKTMVLLHRLRYLLYNKKIEADEFILLVPSYNFKSFINDISLQFKIREKSIIPYQSYYRALVGKANDDPKKDESELVFDSAYLNRVYSKSFIRECYATLFDALETQTEKLIELSEKILNELIEDETVKLDGNVSTIYSELQSKAKELTSKYKRFISVDLSNIEGIKDFTSELDVTLTDKKKEYQTVTKPVGEIKISPDDDRLLNNGKLIQIKEEITAEEALIKKASIFTVRAHKSKLEKLQSKYEEVFKIVEQDLIQEEIRKNAQQAQNMAFVFDGITIEEAEKTLSELRKLVSTTEKALLDLNNQKDNITNTIATEHSREIELLNELIEVSTSIDESRDKYVGTLSPSTHYFERVINIGKELFSLVSILSKDKKNDALDKYKMFSKRTEQQLQSYLNLVMFNACKRKIKDEFDIAICNVYKHYWYIALYCTYLTRAFIKTTSRYVFIDEAQDLSLCEMELINKVNTRQDDNDEIEPIINAFGDVNQVISSHGIKSWSDIKFISTLHQLNENFRNPNQIVSFCNDRLPFKMKEVGVDMEEVDVFESINKAVNNCPFLRENIVFIVKDEYAKKDLMLELQHNQTVDPIIYTVKEVKGLEFKTVCVIDREMTANEQYIAYTRALAKLIVIETLTKYVDETEKLFVEGNDDEDDSAEGADIEQM